MASDTKVEAGTPQRIQRKRTKDSLLSSTATEKTEAE
jgi:hypothetical protein